MKALRSNFVETPFESQAPGPVDVVWEAIESMSDDERILLYENGIVYILWLREKNPSLLKTLAEDARERRRNDHTAV